jgi:hypothetical protein
MFLGTAVSLVLPQGHDDKVVGFATMASDDVDGENNFLYNSLKLIKETSHHFSSGAAGLSSFFIKNSILSNLGTWKPATFEVFHPPFYLLFHSFLFYE